MNGANRLPSIRGKRNQNGAVDPIERRRVPSSCKSNYEIPRVWSTRDVCGVDHDGAQLWKVLSFASLPSPPSPPRRLPTFSSPFLDAQGCNYASGARKQTAGLTPFFPLTIVLAHSPKITPPFLPFSSSISRPRVQPNSKP